MIMDSFLYLFYKHEVDLHEWIKDGVLMPSQP